MEENNKEKSEAEASVEVITDSAKTTPVEVPSISVQRAEDVIEASARASAAPEARVSAAPPVAEAPVDPLEAAKQEIAKLKDAWMRSAADFDNFRKRSRKEVDDAKKSGREELLKELLPVFDNLDRAIASSATAQDVKTVSDGLQMVLKQFESSLGRAGITRVKSVGLPFDPSQHEAIQQVETDEHPAGTVMAEIQPAYMQGDRLVRAAMVVVAKPKTN
ncbi:MAG: nucleotide exchange factor GrpE [Polyangiaceae bacterium]|nr:nucleotide exchange factor GrpE [Polyangiaceae bacterium]